jgi:hypothetical protein
LHEIIDMLPESELAGVERLLQALPVDPVVRALLTAEDDDEPMSDEDRRAIEAADESIRKNGTISTPELRRRLDL